MLLLTNVERQAILAIFGVLVSLGAGLLLRTVALVANSKTKNWVSYIGSWSLVWSALKYNYQISKVNNKNALSLAVTLLCVCTTIASVAGLLQIPVSKLAPETDISGPLNSTYYSVTDNNKNTYGMNETEFPSAVSSFDSLLPRDSYEEIARCMLRAPMTQLNCIASIVNAPTNYSYFGLSSFDGLLNNTNDMSHGILGSIFANDLDEGFFYKSTRSTGQYDEQFVNVETLPDASNLYNVNISAPSAFSYKRNNLTTKEYVTAVYHDGSRFSGYGHFVSSSDWRFRYAWAGLNSTANTTWTQGSYSNMIYGDVAERYSNACKNSSPGTVYLAMNSSQASNCSAVYGLLKGKTDYVSFVEANFLKDFISYATFQPKSNGSLYIEQYFLFTDGTTNLFEFSIFKTVDIRKLVTLTGNIDSVSMADIVQSTTHIQLDAEEPSNEDFNNYLKTNKCLLTRCEASYNKLIRYKGDKILRALYVTLVIDILLLAASSFLSRMRNVIEPVMYQHEVNAMDGNSARNCLEEEAQEMQWGHWFDEEKKQNHLGLSEAETPKAQPGYTWGSGF